MPAPPSLPRVLLYAVAGALVGFLFLAEFALVTIIAVQVGLLLLAVVGLAGALRRARDLELWPVFVASAIAVVLPLDARLAALPRCDGVPAGIGCFAGTRDVTGQFAMDSLVMVVGLLGVVALFARVGWDTWRSAR